MWKQENLHSFSRMVRCIPLSLQKLKFNLFPIEIDKQVSHLVHLTSPSVILNSLDLTWIRSSLQLIPLQCSDFPVSKPQVAIKKAKKRFVLHILSYPYLLPLFSSGQVDVHHLKCMYLPLAGYRNMNEFLKHILWLFLYFVN